MDIRKLQRAIVDGLEDVKGQNIAVFNTEHLSPLFERVIIASGTSNRQTKALASSVRDAVKSNGFHVLRTEGEENGEWIIVDCGAAVVHLMQPAIRQYYHLEEIWGEKPVKMKIDAKPVRLVKASEDEAPAKKAPSKKTAAKAPAAKKAAQTSAAPRKVAVKKAPARTGVTRTVGVKAAVKKVAAKKATVQKVPMKELAVNKVVARKAAAKKAASKSPSRSAPRKVAAKKAARRA